MIIGVLHLSISIPEANSLKDKRSVIRSMKDRTVARMNVSAAEVGKQDLWKAGEFAFVTVAASKMVVEQRLAKLSTRLRADPRYVVLTIETEFL